MNRSRTTVALLLTGMLGCLAGCKPAVPVNQVRPAGSSPSEPAGKTFQTLGDGNQTPGSGGNTAASPPKASGQGGGA